MQFAEVDRLCRQVCLNTLRDGGFWGIGRRHSDGAHQTHVQVTQHMSLVPIDALVFAFAPMAHLVIFDGNAPLLDDFAP
jgi:hypothetical protein